MHATLPGLATAGIKRDGLGAIPIFLGVFLQKEKLTPWLKYI
jgi:hypothetical protein